MIMRNILVCVAVLIASTVAWAQLELPRVEGTPTEVAEKGSVFAAYSEDALWLKAGGLSSNNWTKIRFVPGTATLSNGVVSVTNTQLGTNAVIFTAVTGTATNAGILTVSTVDTNGVFSVTSVRYNGTNYVTNTADNRTVRWISIEP